MKEIDKANGLSLCKGRSKVIEKGFVNLKNDASLESFIATQFGAQDGQAIFYLDYGIRFAHWKSQKLEFYESEAIELEYIQLARIFNKEKELKIWRDDIGHRYRVRQDDTGTECYAVDAHQYLWGTQAEAVSGQSGWTKLREERGTELVVPLKITSKKRESKPLAYIHTRNYINYLPFGQATYYDCRFVEIGKLVEKV